MKTQASKNLIRLAALLATGWLANATAQDVPLAGIAGVGAGTEHTCAVTDGHALLCWGDNAQGQLGDGTQVARALPNAVVGAPPNVSAVAGIGLHSCAVAGGGAWCWGSNSNGEVGDGTQIRRLRPVAVTGLGSGVAALVGGLNSSCALTTGGTVSCWGYQSTASGTTSTVPVAVGGLGAGVKGLAGGVDHSCAVTATDTVKCWGINAYGQLGNGTRTTSFVPVTVSGLADVRQVSAGFQFGCAVTNSGAAKCWGFNQLGMAGNGTQVDSTVPVAVTGLSGGVARVVAGYTHACALMVGGGVKCWGNNSHGQAGDGGQHGIATTPVDVLGLRAAVVDLALGADHACARLADGGLQCWGQNDHGQLGMGDDLDRYTAYDVLAPETVFRNGFEGATP